MIDIGCPNQEKIYFETNLISFRNIKGSDIRAKFILKPSWSFCWDFKILSVFLNYFSNFAPIEEKPTRKFQYKHEKTRYFKFVDQVISSLNIIFIHISNNFEIEVSISQQFLLSDVFTEIEEKKYIYSYHLEIEPKPSSLSIINSEPLSFFNLNDFSSIFIYFVRTMTRNLINNRFTSFLFQFSKFFFKRSIPSSIMSINHLATQSHGYFKILTTHTNFKNLFKLKNEENNYILRGCYISPFAKAILTDNLSIIDGLMLDGTFKVLKNYVTCIIVCISFNTSIPIGFTFSPIEDDKLFNSVFKTFLEITNVDLSQFIIESDQGPSLIKSFSGYHCQHLCCLRHLLANLQKKKYGFEASKLVSCKCQKDFLTLTGQFNSIFQKITDSKEIEKLNKTLLKIGLKFINEEITIFNLDRWNEVSMMQRQSFKMPSTSNSIESIHGHLNEATPRNNLFFSSVYRLIMAINTQIKQFEEKLHHNFNKIIRDIKRKGSNPHIDDECNFYNTQIDSCECGETTLYSNMYRCDVPCSHRYHLGASFPSSPDVHLNLNKQFNEFIPDIQEDTDVINQIETNKIKIIIYKNIKKFSHTKKKDEIKKFIDENYEPQFKKFVMGYPIEFYETISIGIDFFLP